MSLPATKIYALHPPRIPNDFESLRSQALHNRLVFRIHTPLSASPLIWTNDPETSGFSSPNSNLALLSPHTYNHIHRDHRGKTTWTEGPYLTQTIVDHLNSKHRQTGLILPTTVDEGLEIPEDEKTPWISTSRNLTWCIYEISRRLAFYQHENQMDTLVEMAVIKHHSGTVGLQDGKRDVWEVHIDPRGPITKAVRSRQAGSWAQRGEMSVALRSDYEKARRHCENSGEILYYGRIFGVNVDKNMGWSGSMSMEQLPLEIPLQFRKRPGVRAIRDNSSDTDDSKEIKGWLSELVWDPLKDSFFDAERKIGTRMRELKTRQEGW